MAGTLKPKMPKESVQKKSDSILESLCYLNETKLIDYNIVNLHSGCCTAISVSFVFKDKKSVSC